MLPLLLPLKPVPAPGDFWFTLLDVGQGLAAVVHTHRHTLVYDTGARFRQDFDAGRSVVIPYLRQTGIAQVDRLIISHGDNDHIGGAGALLEVYPDTVVLSSVPAPFPYPAWTGCVSGQQWEWDGIKFHILHPRETNTGKENNLSCVLKVSSLSHSILLPGDIEQEAEFQLLHNQKDALKADVLVAPHHGSKTSSSIAFLNTVQPEMVLFPVGYRNRYRFPNQDIMARYETRGVKSYDTAADGAIMIRFTPSGMQTAVWRRQSRRFWHTVD